jgi:HKD family nuclease
MAQLELILQAVTVATHATAISALMERISPDSVLISVGFVRESGVEALEAAIRPVAAHTKMFVGVRNDITSVQAIKRLLRLGVSIYAVDTGSREIIFHPKLYLAVDDGEEAGLIIGSANLTHPGLHNNIEASTQVILNLRDGNERAFVESTLQAFDEMLRSHPQHVFQVSTNSEADALFESGRLADETFVPAPTVVNTVRSGARDSLPRMKLHRVARPRLRPAERRPVTPGRTAAPARVGAAAVVGRAPTPAMPTEDYYLIWESNELTERDLNVPTGATTHRTGSMLWKKGATEGIDQRHFFRSEVFHDLAWTRDERLPHIERTRASFEIVIKDLNYGNFTLQLSHNTSTTSKAYRQNNAMTQLHWGLALPIIARRDLLGRTMSLYRKETRPPEFLIEID